MHGIFTIILIIITLVAGIVWCLEQFKWKPARNLKMFELKKNNIQNTEILEKASKPASWVENVSFIFPILLAVLIFRSFFFEPYHIPSGSMMNTLLIGDFVAVDKNVYGIKDPIMNSTLISTGHPKRGDVAVFKHPNEPQINLVKRVVGLPGDKIIYSVEDKKLIIYPACKAKDIDCEKQNKQPLNITYTEPQESNWKEIHNKNNSIPEFYTLQKYKSKNIQEKANLKAYDMMIQKETLDNKSHVILTTKERKENSERFYHQPDQPVATWIVPEGSYFMMGDNRDNSSDSRYFGFVPEENFVGKVAFIWFSIGTDFDFRFNRIGSINK